MSMAYHHLYCLKLSNLSNEVHFIQHCPTVSNEFYGYFQLCRCVSRIAYYVLHKVWCNPALLNCLP
jgi:hypothetical protein